MSNDSINIFFRKMLVLLLLVAMVAVIYHGATYFLLLFTAIIVAILWRGSAHWLEDKIKLPFKVGLPLVILFNLGCFVAFAITVLPEMIAQGKLIVIEIPNITRQIEEILSKSAIGSKLLTETNGDGLTEFINSHVNEALLFFSSTLNVLVHVLLILAFSLFVAADPKLYIRGIVYLIPKRKQPTFMKVATEIKDTLFRWFIGKILDMLSIFLMTIIGLWILGMPSILTLSLIAFFLSFIPNIGPIISAVPALAIALLDSPQQALHVGLLYLFIQMFESYVVTPNVQKKASYVPPLLLLLVQFLIAKFLGVLGLLLATPILVALMVTVRQLYVENHLQNYEVPDLKNIGKI